MLGIEVEKKADTEEQRTNPSPWDTLPSWPLVAYSSQELRLTCLLYSIGLYARTCVGANKSNDFGGIQLDQQLQGEHCSKEDRIRVWAGQGDPRLPGFYFPL